MPNRKNADELFAQEIASGKLVRDAAQAAGISLATASRRLADPTFKEKVAQIKRNVMERSTARLVARTTMATKRLAKLLKSTDEAIALRAVKITLELAVKLYQMEDLQKQIDELKAEKEGRGRF